MPRRGFCKSTVACERLGDTRPLHDTIEAMVTADPTSRSAIGRILVSTRLLGARCQYHGESDRGHAARRHGCRFRAFSSRSWCEAVAAKARGEISIAHTKLLQARKEIAEVVRQQPNFPVMLSVLGVIDANLGRKDLAIAKAEELSSCCRFRRIRSTARTQSTTWPSFTRGRAKTISPFNNSQFAASDSQRHLLRISFARSRYGIR